MLNYISLLYHSEPIYVHPPCPLDCGDAALACHMEQIRAEMGVPFANKLDAILRTAFNGSRELAFRDGFRLGGQLMLELLADEDQ